MKIKEMVERQCCHPEKDLKEYHGVVDTAFKKHNPKFCVHCGQVWIVFREMDYSGHMEPVWTGLKFEGGKYTYG